MDVEVEMIHSVYLTKTLWGGRRTGLRIDSRLVDLWPTVQSLKTKEKEQKRAPDNPATCPFPTVKEWTDRQSPRQIDGVAVISLSSFYGSTRTKKETSGAPINSCPVNVGT